MKRALITGINGSGASYLAEYLTQLLDVQVMGITRWHTDRSSSLSSIQDKIKLFECDLTDLSSVIRTLEVSQPDFIFHLAAHANVRLCFVNPISVFENNTKSTLNILEAIRILKIKPVLQLAGTSEVYGQVKPEDCPIKETHKIDPVNVYAISKFAQEKFCKSYWLSYGIPVVLTRAFTYINPRRPDIFSSSFARQIVEIEKGKREKLFYGNLDSVRTFVDVRDIAEAYWVAANKCDYGIEYNVGGSETMSVGGFLELLLKYAKCKIPHEQNPELLRPVDVTMQVPDVTKFTEKTGWKPKYTFDDSVKFLLDYFREIVK
ncbi:SDR family oxidoreductase [Candidatus Parcubacteria bacterium]|nr:MAG: SDR family oxidoreductase [Candidatus Parcubacteria bacterium]